MSLMGGSKVWVSLSIGLFLLLVTLSFLGMVFIEEIQAAVRKRRRRQLALPLGLVDNGWLQHQTPNRLFGHPASDLAEQLELTYREPVLPITGTQILTNQVPSHLIQVCIHPANPRRFFSRRYRLQPGTEPSSELYQQDQEAEVPEGYICTTFYHPDFVKRIK